MKLLVLGDAHLEHVTITHAIEQLGPTCDGVVSVGDLMDGVGGAEAAHATIATLRERGVACVAGNHDRWLLAGASRDAVGAVAREALTDDELEWLAMLPPSRVIETPAGRVMIAHGFGADDMCVIHPWSPRSATGHPQWRLLRQERVALHLSGHTHRPNIAWFDDPDPEGDGGEPYQGAVFVNAGTLHRDQMPCACVVDFERRTASWPTYRRGRFEPCRPVRW